MYSNGVAIRAHVSLALPPCHHPQPGTGSPIQKSARPSGTCQAFYDALPHGKCLDLAPAVEPVGVRLADVAAPAQELAVHILHHPRLAQRAPAEAVRVLPKHTQ